MAFFERQTEFLEPLDQVLGECPVPIDGSGDFLAFMEGDDFSGMLVP